ncbi:unnamed protein product [Polarella glacialis]|uniref:Uncharacterized protein n=1 Tax=Polarella glacialis TaxID=89957 RepID=A0A813GN29_POLGL|nr:unnamed protein product [Polarella glacialis]CAE8627931.1 unnamed protein product [Polarella glacialis]
MTAMLLALHSRWRCHILVASLLVSLQAALESAPELHLQRVRLRSGEFPAPLVAEEGLKEKESQGAGPGGLGGSPMPSGCLPELHRPGLTRSVHLPTQGEPFIGGFSPLQRAAVVLAAGSPLGLARFLWAPDNPGSISGWQLSLGTRHLDEPRRQIYVADHRRYSRGGSLWALAWLQDAGSTETEPAATAESESRWAGCVLRLLAAVQALVDGEGPEQALAAMHWAVDPTEWIDAYQDGWHEGVFSALGLLSGLLCHFGALRHDDSAEGSVAGVLGVSERCALGPLTSPDFSGPPFGFGIHFDFAEANPRHDLEPDGCAVAAGLALLREAQAGAVPAGAVLGLAGELLAGCSLHEPAGAAAWSAFWWQLAFWRSEASPSGRRFEGECSAEAAVSSSWGSSMLSLRLCGARPHSSRSGRAELHVLGVSAALGRQKTKTSKPCVLLEAVLHVTSEDGCYVTQAGSNLRTLPQSFLEPQWRCSLSVGPEVSGTFASAHGSATSAFGTDAVVSCAFEAEALRAAAGSAQTLFLHLNAPNWDVRAVPLCVEQLGSHGVQDLLNLAPEPPRLLTVCTGVMFAAGQRSPGSQADAPTLLEQWLAYHEEMGVDHFALYDSDGSAGPVAAPRAAAGKVSYFPHWPSQLSEKLGSISLTPHCRHCLSALAEAHCLWSNRGLSRWVVTLHSFDAYLAVNQGPWGGTMPGATLALPLTLLEPVRREIGTVAIPMLDFGGPPRNSSWLIARFVYRAIQPVQVLAEIGRGNPRDDCWLNHPGVTLKNPENVWGVYDHYARSRPGSTDVEVPFELLRVNHYVDTFGPRCSSRFLHCEVPDAGLLWVLPAMSGRLEDAKQRTSERGHKALQ